MTKKMKLIAALAMTAMLCIIGVVFISPVKVQAAAKKAKVVLEFTDGTQKTWKTGDAKIKLSKKKLAYVYFGEYPQTEVTGDDLTDAIINAKYNKNGVATVKGVKYKRITQEDVTYSEPGSNYFDWEENTYAYFKYEPIKWKVMSSNKNTALLFSEYGLDDQWYNDDWKEVITWADCTLRTWLNDDFLSSAFNTKEKKLIKVTKLKTNNNPEDNTYGGANTKDKVFLLSHDDLVNTKYGFDSDRKAEDINRRCSQTDFARAMGTFTSPGYETSEGNRSCNWWTRTPGYVSYYVLRVSVNGSVSNSTSFHDEQVAVRPALTLNLKSIIG